MAVYVDLGKRKSDEGEVGGGEGRERPCPPPLRHFFALSRIYIDRQLRRLLY